MFPVVLLLLVEVFHSKACCDMKRAAMYEGWNFNSGNYLFTTDTK